MSQLGKIAASVAGPLVSGLFGSKKPKAQGVDYLKLRRDAEAAGFNPLTALLAGGGAGYQREFNPALSSGAFIGEAISRGADTYFSHLAAKDAEAEAIRDREHQKELVQMQIDQRAAGRSFGFALTDQRPYSAAKEVKMPAISTVSSDRPPRSLRSLQKEAVEMWPVRGPDGVWTEIPAASARRLDVEKYGQLIAEDYEALYGEVVGNVESTARSPDVKIFTSTGKSAGPAFGDKVDGKWRPPLTDPRSQSWWRRPLW